MYGLSDRARHLLGCPTPTSRRCGLVWETRPVASS